MNDTGTSPSSPEALARVLRKRFGQRVPQEELFAEVDRVGLSARDYQTLVSLLAVSEAGPAVSEAQAEPDDDDDERRFNTTRAENRFDSTSFELFMKDVSRYPLLSHSELVDLYVTIDKGELAKESLRSGRAPQHAVRELQRRASEADKAFELVVLSNLRLVVNIAKRHVGRGLELPDLVEEGIFGLIRAAQKFDYRKGFHFSTYATWWIRQAVGRAIANNARLIRVPVHVVDELNAVKAVHRTLETELEREPTLSEVARRIRMPVVRVATLLGYDDRIVSMDFPLPGTRTTLAAVLPDEMLSVEDEAIANVDRDPLAPMLALLTKNEQEILTLRYGLDGEPPLTLDAIGHIFGLTRERIRQIAKRSVARLRNFSLAQDLAADFGIRPDNDSEIEEDDPE